MKKVGIYCTYDDLAENISPIFTAPNEKMAIKLVKDAFKKADVSPESIHLYCLGSVDVPTSSDELAKFDIVESFEATNEVEFKYSEK